MVYVSGFHVQGRIEAFHVQDGYLSQSCSTQKRSGQAGEDGDIFRRGVFKALTYLLQVFNGPGCLFFLLGVGRGEVFSSGQEHLELTGVDVPSCSVNYVPCAHAVHEIPDGAAGVGTCHDGDERCEDSLVNGGSVLFLNVLYVAE